MGSLLPLLLIVHSVHHYHYHYSPDEILLLFPLQIQMSRREGALDMDMDIPYCGNGHFDASSLEEYIANALKPGKGSRHSRVISVYTLGTILWWSF